jgi:ubiquinone/menaquinone biosynthesis C-methylase UbiE
MPADRDVAAFEERATGYESGWRGRMHHEIADRVASLAAARAPAAEHILDVGCGTGYLLRQLAGRYPDAPVLAGIDAAPGMIDVARSAAADPRLSFTVGTAEQLPYDDASFDLVVSTTSFDHWRDQRAGLAQCARVLRPGGQLVLCDQFSDWLLPTLAGSRRGKARTKRRATALLAGAGFTAPRWHGIYTVLIRAVTATRATRAVS